MSRINQSKRERLRNMKVFVLDNSLRESTVGQIRGHSFQDKVEILEVTHGCDFHHQIVGAFSTGRRVDDAFAAWLLEKETEISDRCFYAFSEAYDELRNGCMVTGVDHIPVGLEKMKEYRIPNAIIEVDIAYDGIDWDGIFPVSKVIDHLAFLLRWTHENLPPPACTDNKRRNFINLRDFPLAMLKCPDRLLELVKGIANMPPSYRPAGLMQEEPIGEYFPEEVAAWNQEVRDTMDNNGWPSKFQQNGTPDGLLLAHVHKQWGLADAVVLDVLAAGADGIWCSVSEEGAAMGHASSCVTLANLARLGNKDILSRYKTRNLAVAARKVTEVTTNKAVPNRQIVYGPRAIETVFGFSGIAGGANKCFDVHNDGAIDEVDCFSLAEFLGVNSPPIRISTLSSPALVVGRLKQCFGDDPAFTEEIARKMLTRMKEELANNFEEEHTSKVGIALLWKSVTGSFHPKMMCVDIERELSLSAKSILEDAKKCYFEHLEKGKDSMGFKSFYEAYLLPYFGCFACPRTRFVLDAIDLNHDGTLAWREWSFWCKWALREHANEIGNVDDLHYVALRNAIIPLSLDSMPRINEEAERERESWREIESLLKTRTKEQNQKKEEEKQEQTQTQTQTQEREQKRKEKKRNSKKKKIFGLRLGLYQISFKKKIKKQ